MGLICIPSRDRLLAQTKAGLSLARLLLSLAKCKDFVSSLVALGRAGRQVQVTEAPLGHRQGTGAGVTKAPPTRHGYTMVSP